MLSMEVNSSQPLHDTVLYLTKIDFGFESVIAVIRNWLVVKYCFDNSFDMFLNTYTSQLYSHCLLDIDFDLLNYYTSHFPQLHSLL